MARRQTNRETKKKLDDLAASWERLCEELTEIEKRKASRLLQLTDLFE